MGGEKGRTFDVAVVLLMCFGFIASILYRIVPVDLQMLLELSGSIH